MKRFIYLAIVFLNGSILTHSSLGQIMAEAEGSLVTTGYNKIRIPGDEGSTFDTKDDLNSKVKFAYRIRAGYRVKNKHNFFILYAPLKVKYDGNFENPTYFYNTNFAAGQPVDVEYVFNSYRLTYRYDFITTEKLRVGAGLTGKIRDAYIQVSQSGRSAKKDNVGVVPLLNIMIDYKFNDTFGLVLEGDGLATNNGRAFDLQISVPIRLDEYLGAKLGYRVLEGGADNNEVYNFTWFNYLSAGVFYNFY